MKPVTSQSLTRPQVNGDLRGTTDTAEPSPAYRRLPHVFEASCDRDPMRVAQIPVLLAWPTTAVQPPGRAP